MWVLVPFIKVTVKYLSGDRVIYGVLYCVIATCT